MNKTAIKNFAIWARNKLIADIQYKAGLMGVTMDGIKSPLPQSTRETQFFDIGTAEPYAISGEEIKQRESLAKVITKKAEETDYATAYKYVVEGVAYTWFNRLIAVRFMEVNDYLPSHIRVLSSESGKMEPDLVTNPFDAELPLSEEEKEKIVSFKNDNKLDECFRMLFIKQCNALNEVLPALFEKTSDYTEVLLNVSAIDKEGVVYHLVNDIPEEDFNIEQGGQVEIIGWLYQYYNTEPKNEAFAKKTKITKEEIPAVTQLFTPDWIVRYMVENSLGRMWVEGHPNDSLKKNWKYYLEEAEQEPEVKEKLAEIHSEYAKLNPEDIHFIDPCMGSGHILVYAFEVFMQIYESAGYSKRDAAKSILEHNLYGLDIDDRAYQMAYFAVMMKARQYIRWNQLANAACHVYSIQESNGINRDQLTYFGAGLSDEEKKEAINQVQGLLDTFKDAKEYGSIINVENYDWNLLRRFADNIDVNGQMTFDVMGIDETQEKIRELTNIGETMARKYEVCTTNPPYMGFKGMNTNMAEYLKTNYFDYKSDLFSTFIIKCTSLCKKDGFSGFLSPYVWMFIQSYEKLREYLYHGHTIQTLIQFEYSAFEEATVPICTFVVRNRNINKNGCYIRLTDYIGGMEVQRIKALEAIRNHDCGFYFEADSSTFENIPGKPVGYWVPRFALEAFKGKRIDFYAETKQGFKTGNNDLFLKLWFEVGKNKTALKKENGKKWYPCNKGGDYRKWYGNKSYVVDWENDGSKLKGYKDENGRLLSRPQNIAFNFREGLSWSTISSGPVSFRFSDENMMFESKGSMCFIKNKKDTMPIFAFLNSNVCMYYLKIIAPTLDYSEGAILKLPVISTEMNCNYTIENCIEYSRNDWNSFETSWDYEEHPLVRLSKELWDATSIAASMQYYYGWHTKVSCPLELCFMLWQGECNERFKKLKENEEELNRIFINIYGLQDELRPDVDDKDITVRKADLQRDIKSLISYAVGCMFGRYSLDVEGLAYAGGEWDASKYSTFIPDADNILPITDEEYLEDDIVGLLIAWLKKVYGAETLEQNLDFIAKALGNKGNSSREIIRNYFLNDFFKDHCQTYSVTGSGKRPIYWLFDSGKQNGFKALIYLHRYNADTIGNLRVDYLHRMQRVYESEIGRMQDMIDHSTNSREVGAATKRKEKLQKQLKECREYDEKIGHLALARTELDLDDGVKYNYRKVQLGSDGKFYEVLADSKAIMMDAEKFRAFKK
ncbi:BREX-1 system adenine-specific DNA-methyltransferase PglX [Oribacterium sp. WCC10]|uniref:BREX-1 system adenine-specific DNA-methyltransferase PglX n=1 Tax=Oribacterium sp. WCC10 TaxID=1855343 RepID=UPI0008EE7D04|nr:BREX-1 system adenine-specific DNA-methyltransferase PglX [Oribacterium sp. WCC10]SFG31075.1 hypothetical protein SAMN05216356_105116 [Oribacterium sp. WCC10]